jgi:hypothetical protein
MAGRKKPTPELAGSRRERISSLLTEIESQLNFKSKKPTLADFIRLTQLERELEDDEQPKEIIVRWSDPVEKRDGSK